MPSGIVSVETNGRNYPLPHGKGSKSRVGPILIISLSSLVAIGIYSSRTEQVDPVLGLPASKVPWPQGIAIVSVVGTDSLSMSTVLQVVIALQLPRGKCCNSLIQGPKGT